MVSNFKNTREASIELKHVSMGLKLSQVIPQREKGEDGNLNMRPQEPDGKKCLFEF